MLLLLALLTVGQALGLLQAMSANLVGSGLALPAGLTVAGEFVLLALLLLAPWLVRPARWERRAVVAGIAAALLVAGMLAGNASTTRILALWTFGLAMPAPSLLYAVAAGLLTATAVARWRQGDRAVAAGLALVTLGGYVPPNSYQADLLIAGVILLAWPALLAAPERGTPVTAGAGN